MKSAEISSFFGRLPLKSLPSAAVEQFQGCFSMARYYRGWAISPYIPCHGIWTLQTVRDWGKCRFFSPKMTRTTDRSTCTRQYIYSNFASFQGLKSYQKKNLIHFHLLELYQKNDFDAAPVDSYFNASSVNNKMNFSKRSTTFYW